MRVLRDDVERARPLRLARAPDWQSGTDGSGGAMRAVIRVVARVAGAVRRLGRRLPALGRRRRRPARLHDWVAMDARLLADIGMSRSDVQAMAVGITPAKPLRDAGGAIPLRRDKARRAPATPASIRHGVEAAELDTAA